MRLSVLCIAWRCTARSYSVFSNTLVTLVVLFVRLESIGSIDVRKYRRVRYVSQSVRCVCFRVRCVRGFCALRLRVDNNNRGIFLDRWARDGNNATGSINGARPSGQLVHFSNSGL